MDDAREKGNRAKKFAIAGIVGTSILAVLYVVIYILQSRTSLLDPSSAFGMAIDDIFS